MDEIQSCISKYPLDTLLGKGEFGRTYSIQGNDQIAIKIIWLPNRKALTEFESETGIQTILGDHDVAPKIHESWTCKAGRKTYGFIVMDRLLHVYRDLYPDQSLEQLDEDEIREDKNPVLPPKEVQYAVVGCLEKSIQLGYIHNDNHGGNIGFGVDGHVKLFDYGFTRKVVEECSSCNQTQLLAFALYQLIEHLPLSLRNDSAYYDLIYLIRQGKYRFGSHIRAFQAYSIQRRSQNAESGASTRKRSRRTRRSTHGAGRRTKRTKRTKRTRH